MNISAVLHKFLFAQQTELFGYSQMYTNYASFCLSNLQNVRIYK